MKRISSVLVIDDNPGDALLVELRFAPTGRYGPIHSVETGRQAYELFADPEHGRQRLGAAFPPRLILLDINMPEMGGFEFLEAYLALPVDRRVAGVIIVMLTSSSEESDRERARGIEVVSEFLPKPPRAEDAIRLAEKYGTDTLRS